MSALGQKQTCAVQKRACPLLPKADICGATGCPLCANSGHCMSRNNVTRRGHQANGGSALSYLGPQLVDGIDAFPSEIDIVPSKVSICRRFAENGPFQAKVSDHPFWR